jgi:hypothetical protein
MSEPTKISFLEWGKYEWHTIKRAWSEIRASYYIRPGVYAAITAILTYWGLNWAGFASKHENAARCIIAACAGLAAFILVFGVEFLIKLLVAPAKTAKEADGKIAALEKEKEELLIVVETLSNKKELERAKAMKKKSTDRMLAMYFKSLEHWIGHLKLVEAGIVKDADISKSILETSDLCLEIGKFIEDEIGSLEAASFGSSSDKVTTPVNANAQEILGEKAAQIRMLIDLLSHRSSKLREIIGKRMSNSQSV